uniref:Uncharacterized protein n=1 Tax=Trichogramma kaykai TaxID=54128 RepID=A0ABD2W777_9HYME
MENNIIVGKTPKPFEDGISKSLLDAMAKDPDFVAQINADTGERTTFGQMRERTIRCALWLRKRGIVHENDVVAVSTPNQSDDYVPFFAALYLGVVFNPWYHDLARDKAERFFELLEPKVMFACARSIDGLSRAARAVGSRCLFVCYERRPGYPCLRDALAEQRYEEVDDFRHLEPDAPEQRAAVIFFSSGTTGEQKGIAISYAAVPNHRFEYEYFEPASTVLWYSYLSWITATSYLLLCVRTRSTRIVHGPADADETSRVVERYKVNYAFFTSPKLTQLCKAQALRRHDYSSLRRMMVGGSRCRGNTLQEVRRALPHCHVFVAYGTTEMSGVTTTQLRCSKIANSIGHVLPGVRAKIVDVASGETLGPHRHGEICFDSEHKMLGYWKNPEKTRAVIDEEGWLHTEDFGFYDEDGEISVLGRIKEVMRLADGRYASAGQIEDRLVRHPDVAEVAVIPTVKENDVQLALAFVVAKPDAKATSEELRRVANSHDDTRQLLSVDVTFVDRLPCTPTGKKIIPALIEMAREL